MPAPSKSWTVVADGAVDADSPIDQALMTALRDNLVHLEEWLGHSFTAAQDHDHDGANSKSVVLESAVISQSKLKTTTGDVTTVSNGGVFASMPGGDYGFWPQMGTDGELSGVQTAYVGWGGATTESTDFSLVGGSAKATMFIGADGAQLSHIIQLSSGVSGGTSRVRQRYVQSSPPWCSFRKADPVPFFTIAMLERGSGRGVACYEAFDPPWCNNGPTVINPLGRLRLWARQLLDVDLSTSDPDAVDAELIAVRAALTDPATRRVLDKYLSEPLTDEQKNADMAIVPHPFPGYDKEKHVIVYVHPTDDRLGRGLAARYDLLTESIASHIYSGRLLLDNDPMPGLITPRGVMAVRAKWKLARA